MSLAPGAISPTPLRPQARSRTADTALSGPPMPPTALPPATLPPAALPPATAPAAPPRSVLQATIEGPDAVARLIASGSAAGGMPPAPAAAAGSRAAPAGDSAALGRALVSQQCDTCNERKMAAKRAQEDFDKVYLCVFLRNAAAPFDTWATVEELGGNFCKVVVDGLGLTFQCYYDRNGANGDMDGESTVILTPAEPPSTETAKAAVARLTTAERRWAGQPARAIPFKVTADVTRLAKNRSVHVEPPPEDSSGSGDSAIAAAIAAAKGEGASDADPLIDGDATSAKIEAAATPYPTQLTLSLLSRVRVRLIVRDDKIPSGEHPLPPPWPAFRTACRRCRCRAPRWHPR